MSLRENEYKKKTENYRGSGSGGREQKHIEENRQKD